MVIVKEIFYNPDRWYLFEEENDLLFEVIAVWPPKAAEVDEAPEAAPNPPPAADEPPPVDDDDSTGGQAGALDWTGLVPVVGHGLVFSWVKLEAPRQKKDCGLVFFFMRNGIMEGCISCL